MDQYYVPASHIPARFKREMTRQPYKASRVPVEKEYRFDGQGGYASNSGRIPLKAVPGAIATLVILGFMLFVGTAVFQ